MSLLFTLLKSELEREAGPVVLEYVIPALDHYFEHVSTPEVREKIISALQEFIDKYKEESHG